MDSSYPTSRRYDFFDARINEECQNDGAFRQPVRKPPKSKSHRVGIVEEVSGYGSVEVILV